MEQNDNKDDNPIVAKECRFVVHIPANSDREDQHLIRETLHKKDGSVEENTRLIKNFKRPFFLTMPQYRTYKQKKEVESLDRLMRFESTQSDLRDNIANALDLRFSRDHIKKLSNSPYLYGSEISSQSIIKKLYQNKNKTHNTPYSVMSFDIETDMEFGTQEPIIITAVFNNELFLAVTKKFIKGINNAEGYFRSGCSKYITEFTDLSKYNITYIETEDTVDLIKKTFAWIHSKQFHFLSIWNIAFDIPKIIDALVKYGIDPADVLCDPSIPKDYRICKWKPGPNKKRKANGQEVPIDFADQWHTLILTASFYVIDAMCTYRLLRLAKPKESSYSLDSTLDRELGVRKLKFKEADSYVKERWHIFMQSQHKVEYMVYALFDSLSMQLLDEKLLDVRSTLPSYAGITPFSKCNSKPKLIADALHFYTLSKGYVLNSVGETVEAVDKELEEEMVIGENIGNETDPEVMGLTDWILTLPCHLTTPGLPLVEESPSIRTKIRAFVYDSDCVSAYPTATSILNVSKSTTKREIVKIDDIEERAFRLQNINLCTGHVNSLEYGTEMFNLPTLVELEHLIE